MSTLVVYPDAGAGGITVDGYIYRYSGGAGETFTNIRTLTGTTVNTSSTNDLGVLLYTSGTTNQFSQCTRSIFTFNTASLTNSASISLAIFSLFGVSKTNGLGNDTLNICSATPNTNNNLITSDYLQLGTTSFGNVSYASFSTSGYNDINLDSNGIGNISKTSISKFGARGGWDISGSFGGTWASNTGTYFEIYFADQTGTTNDPKLTITYTTPSNSNFFLLF